MSAPSSFNTLHTALEEAADHDEFAGVVVVRRGPEHVFEGAYGPASRRWPVPVELHTRFDTASVTKAFTAVAVLQQVEAGRLALDEPIHELVDLAGTQIPVGVTIGHLLTHTSGIADDADEEAGEDYAALWVDKPCYSVTETVDFLPQFVHKAPNFAPGEGCRYCNAGYVLAGLALEKVTGQGYREYVVEHVFGPAKMRTAGFFDRRDPAPDVAEGWDPVRDADGRLITWRQNIFSYPPIGSPDGGAQVAAEDLLAFSSALRAGRLLGPAMTAAFLSPQVVHHRRDDGSSVQYGYGLEFDVSTGGEVRSWSKEGINTGASGILRHYPDRGVDVVVLAGSEDGAWQPIRWVHDLVLGLPTID